MAGGQSKQIKVLHSPSKTDRSGGHAKHDSIQQPIELNINIGSQIKIAGLENEQKKDSQSQTRKHTKQ